MVEFTHFIGLANPKKRFCLGSSCDGLLNWIDGDVFQHQAWMGANVPIFDAGGNIGSRTNTVHDDIYSSAKFSTVCQMTCSVMPHGKFIKLQHLGGSVCYFMVKEN